MSLAPLPHGRCSGYVYICVCAVQSSADRLSVRCGINTNTGGVGDDVGVDVIDGFRLLGVRLILGGSSNKGRQVLA